MRNSLIFKTVILLLAGGAAASAGEIDVTHAPVVLTTVGGMTTPITHLKYFLGERERFGYNPLFTPAPVSFDLDNIPYMRVGVNPQGYDVFGEFTTLGIIQTLDATGRWINLTSWLDNISTRYRGWDKIYSAGVSGDERIVFDGAGDAYTVVNTSYDSTVGNQSMLLYSKDKCRTWLVYPLPTSIFFTRLEYPEAWNDTGNPPVLYGWPYGFPGNYGYTGGPIYLLAPTKTTSGGLNIPPLVTLTSDPYAYGSPEGMGNVTITKGNYVYAVYQRWIASPDNTSGTPQYIVVCDNVSKTVTGPVFLGASDSAIPDVHDGPAITIDSQGYLHVILGSHGGRFKYTRSLVPYSITGGWTTPVFIGDTGDVLPEWTYISLLCDKNDTLHVIGRYSGHGYYFGLWYLRKKAGQDWQSMGPLVMPFRGYYSNWYQKLTMDRQGRLFLNYIYYGDQYDRENHPNEATNHPQIDNYTARWPWEGTHELLEPAGTSWSNLQGHDPCVIMSDDGGDHWRLALTSSLQVFFSNNTFDNGLDGWTLTNGASTTPIQAASSYTCNGITITPRTGPLFARSEASSANKKAVFTVGPAQAGTVTGYLNMAQNTNVGMIGITGGGHIFYILANSTAGNVSYRIDSAETAAAIAVTAQAWHQVRFVVGTGGVDGYWDGTLLFHSSLATQVSSIVFGSEWASAPCGYDDFSFLPGSVLGGRVVLGGYSGDPRDVSVKIDLRKSGSLVRTERVNLDTDGRFTLAKNAEQGTYDIAISAYHHLRKVLSGVDLTANPIDLGTITLTGGDMDGNNAVNSTDLSILLNNLDTMGN